MFFSLQVTKVIFILNWNFILPTGASGLKEADQVQESQEKVVHALQQYTVAHYPEIPSKFAELLLRMPELQRICQVRFVIFYRVNKIEDWNFQGIF